MSIRRPGTGPYDVETVSLGGSTPIEYELGIDADASDDEVAALIAHVDAIAEIPNSIRNGTEVRLAAS